MRVDQVADYPSDMGALRTALTGDALLDGARDRWDRCQEWESDFRRRFIADAMFSNGDSDNGYQWPEALRAARDVAAKPCLTINMIRQHNLMISNGLRKSKASVRVVGTGNGATEESAACFRDCIRRIEYISQAQQCVYPIMRKWQIDCGIGWTRIITDYADEETFDQEIFLRPIIDPLTIYNDPECKMFDCSDQRFLFAFDRMLPEDLEAKYPGQGPWQRSPLGIGPEELENDDRVRVLEYFIKHEEKDRLVSFVGGGGNRIEMKYSLLKQITDHQEIMKHNLTKVREITVPEIRRYFVVGMRIIEDPDSGDEFQVWPGKYIPFVPAIGEQVVVRGRLDRKGHTRDLKDAQRMYNYHASSQVEHIAMQGKTPWYGAADAISGFEGYWSTANTKNHAYLPFRILDSEGNPIPPAAFPQRAQPPQASPAYESAMQSAFNWMMMASGQWQNQMGMMGNERTGAAIDSRKEQGDTATLHFEDNYEGALQSIGRQLIDLIPKIYDTERVRKIQAEDGAERDIFIDPTAKEAYKEQVGWNGEVVKRIFNPSVGKYDVAASVGPAYGTKRQETQDALGTILTQNPGLTGIIGDLLMSSFDFEAAQEASRRLKRLVPPQALGKGPTQREQQLQAQVQTLQLQLQKALETAAKDKLKLVGKTEMRNIDAYKAETDRLKVITPDPAGLEQLARQLVQDALTNSMSQLESGNEASLVEENPQAPAPTQPSGPHPSQVPGAQLGPDGEYYMVDPTRRGRYLKIGPLAQQRQIPTAAGAQA